MCRRAVQTQALLETLCCPLKKCQSCPWVEPGSCLEPAPRLSARKANPTSGRDTDKGGCAWGGQGAAEQGSPQPDPQDTARGEAEVTSFCKPKEPFHPQVVPGVPINGSWAGGAAMGTAGSWTQTALSCHVEAKHCKGAQPCALCFLDD